MRYLAIDYGQKRIGLAVSDAGGSMAFPHSVLETQADPIANIARLVRDERIEAIVVGLPLNMDGSEGPQVKAVRAFAQKLSIKVNKAITFFDERLSSAEADWKLAGLELSRQKKKKLQDAVAAAAFLQTFLDKQKQEQSGPQIIQLQTPDDAARKAVEIFTLTAHQAIEHKGCFVCAISGGESPREFFKLLPSEKSLDWNHIHIFWADERGVKPEHPDSNFKLANETFLSKVSIPQENIHRVETEMPDIHRAAEKYEETLRDVFMPSAGHIPQFDLVILGLGVDGHTASLLPGSDVINVTERLAVVVDLPTLPYPRITLTVGVLRAAHQLLFLITGQKKAQIVKAVLHESCDGNRWPVHTLWSVRHKMLWLLDLQAASELR